MAPKQPKHMVVGQPYEFEFPTTTKELILDQPCCTMVKDMRIADE
jgi:hypothetical protein